MVLEDDPKRLARLLMSVNTESSDRPLMPIEVASEINNWINENKTMEETSRKLSLKTTDMVKQFLALLKLPSEIRNAVEWGESKSHHLGFTAAAEIAALTDSRDMEKVGKAAIEYGFNKEDIISIVQLRKRNPNKTIEDCIQEIKEFRPKITEGYLVVCNIDKSMHKIFEKFVRENNTEASSHLKKILAEELAQKSITGLSIRQNTVHLTLDKEGYNMFLSIPTKYQILLKDVFNFLINKGIKNSNEY